MNTAICSEFIGSLITVMARLSVVLSKGQDVYIPKPLIAESSAC